MLTLGQNNIIFLRSALKQGDSDPFVMMRKLEYYGSLSFDEHLIAIEEAKSEMCYDIFEVMLASSAITMYHHCVMVVDGAFWKWGVTWLDIKQYPKVQYQDPETIKYPIIWEVE